MIGTVPSQEVVRFRRATREIAQAEALLLKEHLESLAPLVNPAPLLGDLSRVGAKGASGPGARAAEFAAMFHQIVKAKPFGDDRELEPPVEVVSARIEPRTHQYRHPITRAEGKKVVVVTTPLKFVLSYPGFEPAGLRSLLAQRDPPWGMMRQFVLSLMVLNFMTARRPAFVRLLEGLRYYITTETLPEFGDLPLTCVALSVPTVRPVDETILEITELSGVDQTEEFLDPSSIFNLRDPVRERLLASMNGLADGSRVA